MRSNDVLSLPATEAIRFRFLQLTGLNDVKIVEERAGPEVFLRFEVGEDAPLYRHALAIVDRELDPQNAFHGRLNLKILKEKYKLHSRETELLRSLITRSLRVTSEQASDDLKVDFVPFRGREEQTIAQPANHIILGRRGVGKSSLVLLGVRRLTVSGHVPIWIDLQPYRARKDPGAVIEILREILRLAVRATQPTNQSLVEAQAVLDKAADRRSPSARHVQILLPQIRQHIRDFTQASHKQVYVFLDDAHLPSMELQPFLFDAVHSVLKGAGGWINVAGVKHLTSLYDSGRSMGLQVPHDAQSINLDLTLTDPGAARDYLLTILEKFILTCGIRRRASVIPDSAIERLVWCSAGVPRDFLWLFQNALQHAIQNKRNRVGVQEVNLAVGEFGQSKMQELAEDTTEESTTLRSLVDNLQRECLDKLKSNSFLIKYSPHAVGYKLLQKLMDLRLIHLLHPSITPGKAGERYEAYLLDYSFYTGVRRRHGLKELRISAEAPLRHLPKIDVQDLLVAQN
jgi:hypothetical protein